MASSSFFCFSRIPACLSLTTLKRRSLSSRCSLFVQPPDVAQLAESARISLTSNEIEEFGPKIKQVIDWFGQLQAANLESIEPALRADKYRRK
ncbi:glutamyl-tRNA(Gln) amidotransferase subunit C, chloroplastic/mitochondrial isoform X2 [Amborella trichopoda]|uniref:glutamyl-tRNA(Gln) amidotransferase subunit C, chloroplastic/mitochondrial isoform X2 n=1 Tax=Amborella trichopoda TaxID=13333 RepID=UPI0009BD1488|nr:glutamyl-tRNA(Gln) amidotransferase subunit C, chloroplastic/mitochondrial isoform X2 [Amborella trichopoda]|eukprot:XP_020531661.1 glutamyl-tRNA(Gln) amidotransferase subunit C, chloroplastic/mitochondrial isoform X2 [Amborella trichopoda]